MRTALVLSCLLTSAQAWASGLCDIRLADGDSEIVYGQAYTASGTPMMSKALVCIDGSAVLCAAPSAPGDVLRINAHASSTTRVRIMPAGRYVEPCGSLYRYMVGPWPWWWRGYADLRGTEGRDYIEGASGNDVLYGRGGHDDLHGGRGGDTIYGGDGYDWIWGEGGGDLIDGGECDDYIYGGSGDDVIKGRDGDDVINGGDGDDEIYGHDGVNDIAGGPGDDLIVGGINSDLIDGGPGDDEIYGGQSMDIINGDDGDDVIYGEDGDDRLCGWSGSPLTCLIPHPRDYIDGGDGTDTCAAADAVNCEIGF